MTAIVVMSALSGCFSATAAKSKTVKSGSWKYTVSKNTAEICKYTGREKSVTIPEKLGGKRVVSVGKRAFFRNDTITSVRIPKTIRTIGKSAFEGCKSLGKITFAIGLRTIGQEAFYECTSLTSVKLPDTVTELEKSAFCWCEKLRTLKLSKNIRVINAHTFNSTLITKVKRITNISRQTAAFYITKPRPSCLPILLQRTARSLRFPPRLRQSAAVHFQVRRSERLRFPSA